MTDVVPPLWREKPRAEIAANVRAALGRAAVDATTITNALGLHRSSMRDRLNGRTSFTAEEIVAVADFLNIPVTTLLELNT